MIHERTRHLREPAAAGGELWVQRALHQIATAMTTGRAQGNQTLNEELARLVTTRKVEPQEALSKAIDKADLLRRIG